MCTSLLSDSSLVYHLTAPHPAFISFLPVYSGRFPVLHLTVHPMFHFLRWDQQAGWRHTHTHTHTPHHLLRANLTLGLCVQRLIKALIWCMYTFPMEIWSPADTVCASFGLMVSVRFFVLHWVPSLTFWYQWTCQIVSCCSCPWAVGV